MKAQRNEEKQFIPVTLMLETQHEVDALYAVLNHKTFNDAVLGLDGDSFKHLAPFKSENYVKIHEKIQAFRGGRL